MLLMFVFGIIFQSVYIHFKKYSLCILNSLSKTDINECLLRNGHGGCQDKCVNTIGGYTCSCENLKGTKLSKDGHSCELVEICSINNGGCSHTCHDTIGN